MRVTRRQTISSLWAPLSALSMMMTSCKQARRRQQTVLCVAQANLRWFVSVADGSKDADKALHGPLSVKPVPRGCDSLRPLFAWLPSKIGCQASAPPALSIHCRDEPMAADTIEPDAPAIDGGKRHAQAFVGTCSLVADACGLRSPAQLPGSLNDNVVARGTPAKLVSNRAQFEISKCVKETLCTPHSLIHGRASLTTSIRHHP